MRVLILGGTGMLGHKLWQRLGARFADCQTTVRGKRADYERFGLLDDPRVIEKVDVTNPRRLAASLDAAAANVVVNCIAVTKRREAPAGPTASILLNAWLPHRLAEWTAAHDARLITLSTDCVFDGARGGFAEDDEPNARDVYGRTKALGEVAYGNALPRCAHPSSAASSSTVLNCSSGFSPRTAKRCADSAARYIPVFRACIAPI